jgi:predicted lipid-binding transport protein (Tim44 family)
MKSKFLAALLVSITLTSSIAESRVGNSRSFGNRGSRGFSSSPYRSTPPRSFDAPRAAPYGNSFGSRSQPYNTAPQNPYSYQQQPSMWRTFGAGIAGGFLGGALARSLGWGGGGGMMGGYPDGTGYYGRGGIGILEVLLFGALIFFLIRMLNRRSSATSSASSWGAESSDHLGPPSDSASDIMKRARPGGWFGNSGSGQGYLESSTEFSQTGQPIHPDLAMDLFFQIQGAWGNRDLSSIQNLLDSEAKSFLEEEISRLKRERKINRLENIAVRNADVVETWNEMGKDYSTVHFTANVRDYMVDDATQQVVEGSKDTPVKFDEYWTFSKDSNSRNWKLSAIQQS